MIGQRINHKPITGFFSSFILDFFLHLVLQNLSCLIAVKIKFSCFLVIFNFNHNLTLYLCFLQKLIQFWIVSLLEVSLAPVRVGGSPLSLKHPKFPGTVGRADESGKKTISYMQHLRCSLHHTVRRGFHMIREDQMYNGIKVQQKQVDRYGKKWFISYRPCFKTLFTWSICCFNFLIMFVINA